MQVSLIYQQRVLTRLVRTDNLQQVVCGCSRGPPDSSLPSSRGPPHGALRCVHCTHMYIFAGCARLSVCDMYGDFSGNRPPSTCFPHTPSHAWHRVPALTYPAMSSLQSCKRRRTGDSTTKDLKMTAKPEDCDALQERLTAFLKEQSKACVSVCASFWCSAQHAPHCYACWLYFSSY